MAIAWFHDALQRQPNEPLASRSLARALLQSGKREEAIAAYKDYLVLNPDSNEALHFLHAAENNPTDMPPTGYIASLFDNYAPRFEGHLSGSLGYRAPEILKNLVVSSGESEGMAANAIDLGCGTGLAGEAFKDLCETLVGVDLSNNMLHQAREKGVYAQLLNADITEAIEQLGMLFDLFICADTLVYIGNIQPLFASIANHSESGTLLTFSTEIGQGENFELLPSGRYCHSDNYVKHTAAAAGFDLVKFEEHPLRKEGRQWISGGYYLFKYR